MRLRTRFIVECSLLLLAIAGALLLGQAATLKVAARPLQVVTPFLYPPFFGRASEESIFDHSSPVYTMTDEKIVTYRGETLTKDCPNPEPAGIHPPNGICDAGFGGYWSYQLGNYVYYNGHDGIDYGISYRPVIAAADADEVLYAGWADPTDHRLSLGIYVRLHHPNGYNTLYGHLSALAVQSCLPVGCAHIPHGEIIATSGTTGNSSGPHLHLTVTDPQGRRIDPYGWAGVVGRDALTYNQRESLWVELPNISASSNNVYPSGDGFTVAPSFPAGTIVDNSDARFDQIPSGCWTTYSTSQSVSQGGQMLAVRPITSGSDTCKARWKLSDTLGAGLYAVSVRIPSVHATSEGALYVIVHNGITAQVVVNQAVYPNVSVADGWVYLGKYYFDGESLEYVQLGNHTQDLPSAAADTELGADAVRFAPIVVGTLTPTELPTITPTRTITLTPTVTKTPTITLTPTPSYTPTVTRTRTMTNTLTVTRTFTVTRTPSITPTFTLTRTPSKTPTITLTRTGTRTPPPSATPRPTNTRWPTLTPSYNKINVYFANKNRLALNQPPYESVRSRYVRSSLNIYQETLNAYFTGPGASESYYGDITIYDGFSGYSKLEITDGVARVFLIGECHRQRLTYTIAQLIQVNLKQYPVIQSVKIYDQGGQTQNPDGSGDSVPLCLDPSYNPTPTPTLSATPTLTRTPTRTLTPTKTRLPTNTPFYNKVNVYFASNYRLSIHQPPYLVNGIRYARSIYSVYNVVLDEFFKGPGATEYSSLGYRALYDGFTGYDRVEIDGDVARVYLKGVCQRQRPDYGIADLINANLRQFPAIHFVKLYDQNGQTTDPDGTSNSLPQCLQSTPTP